MHIVVCLGPLPLSLWSPALAAVYTYDTTVAVMSLGVLGIAEGLSYAVFLGIAEGLSYAV